MNKYDREELETLIFVENLPYEEIGRRYQVSGNSIKKAARRLGIELPVRRKINPTETFNRKDITHCIQCGNALQNKQIKFCSRQCKADYDYKIYIDRWKSGKEQGIVGKDSLSKFIVRYMREKYDDKCQKCGWHEVNPFTGKVPLHVHHINGDALDNREDNLQLLCPNCHSLTDNYGSLNRHSTRTTLQEYRNLVKDKANRGSNPLSSALVMN